MNWTRRSTLELGCRALVGAAGLLSPFALGCTPAEPGCYDPELLSTPERSLRRARAYTDHSSHRGADGALQRCAGCQFFGAGGAVEGCGACQILGGPVSAAGRCDAWSPSRVG